MSSRIEQLIDEIEEYIDNCKYQPLSNSKIIVNKDEIDDLLRELRQKTPEEIKRYQKIISNKEAILNDAREKAQALINEATEHTTELINEHEIMQQAYAQANEVVQLATRQAQDRGQCNAGSQCDQGFYHAVYRPEARRGGGYHCACGRSLPDPLQQPGQRLKPDQ